MAEQWMNVGGVTWSLHADGRWYSVLGCVVRDGDHAWFAFPLDDDESSRGGLFRTMPEACASLTRQSAVEAAPRTEGET